MNCNIVFITNGITVTTNCHIMLLLSTCANGIVLRINYSIGTILQMHTVIVLDSNINCYNRRKYTVLNSI